MYASRSKRLCVREVQIDPSITTTTTSTSTSSNINNNNNNNNSLADTNTTTSSFSDIDNGCNSYTYSNGDSNFHLVVNKLDCKTNSSNATGNTPNHDKLKCINPGESSTATATKATKAINSWVMLSSHRQNMIDSIEELDPKGSDNHNLEIILDIQNQITAWNGKKLMLVNHPNFLRLVNLMKCQNSSSYIKCHLALLFCSIAKSSEEAACKLIDFSIHITLYKGLYSHDQALIEACLRCLRAIVCWPNTERAWLFYDDLNNKDVITLAKMLSFASPNQSIHTQECISDIFAFTCIGERRQNQLFKSHALTNISQLLESISSRVIISTINWLTQTCSNNVNISRAVANLEDTPTPILSRLLVFMTKDKYEDLQFVVARCYAFIFRASKHIKGKPLDTKTYEQVSHVVSCLVRLVKDTCPPILRHNSAKCLAYLIEDRKELQELASNCDDLIGSLIDMLDYDVSTCSDYDPYDLLRADFSRRIDLIIGPTTMGIKISDLPNDIEDINQAMTQAAFLSLAVLGSTEESIRKKIFNNSPVMQFLVKNLSETEDQQTVRAALTCLLSLSRSVQQLRTTFVETSVYNALKNLLGKTSDDLLILVLAILCNVSVEFSPGKQQFLDDETIDTLCELTHSADETLRLHGMWILMNIVYQDRNQNLKFQIMKSLGISHLTNLLEKETNDDIKIKTLGFLRNVLSQRSDIEAMMRDYGEEIVTALIRIIESENRTREIEEQTLCVLTNIADGSNTKDFLMNSIILNYLAQTIANEEGGNLRLAAICCVTNLIYFKTDGCSERRAQLKKYGIDEKLRGLLHTTDPGLSDRVRTAHNQFVMGEKSES